MMAQRTVEDYLALPYTVIVVRDQTGAYSGLVARVVELPGCMTQADSYAELGEMLDEAMRLWIAGALEDGLPIPLPSQGVGSQSTAKRPRRHPRHSPEQSAVIVAEEQPPYTTGG